MRKFIDALLPSPVLKFILVGGCSTGIDLAIYTLLSVRLSITVSKGISMIMASVFSYTVNKRFTFHNKDKTNIGYLTRFYIIFAANFVTNLGINYLIYKHTSCKFAAFMSATLCGMLVNYLGQRFFVFNGKKQ